MKKITAFVLAAAFAAAFFAGCTAQPAAIEITAEPTYENVEVEALPADPAVLPFEEMEPDELFELMGEMYPVLDALTETMERGYFGVYELTEPAFVWDTLRVLYRRDGSAEVSADGSEDTVPGELIRALSETAFNGAPPPALPAGYPAAYDEAADTYTFTVNPDLDIATDILRVEQQDDGAAVVDVALLGRPDEKEFVESFRFILAPDDEGSYPYTVVQALERYTDAAIVREVRDTDEGYVFVVDYVDYISERNPEYKEGDPEGLMWERRVENPEEEGVELILSEFATVDGTGMMGLMGDTQETVDECIDDVCEPGDSDYLIENCTRLCVDGQPLYLAMKIYNGRIYDIALLNEWYFAS